MIRRLAHCISQDLAMVRHHWKEHGLHPTLALLRSRDAPVTFQFSKYVIFGGVTTIVHLGLFIFFSHTIFPAHDYLVEGGVPVDVQERNAIVSNLLAFPIAAAVNYLFNVKFVFTSGRHSRVREIFLFIGISFLSFAVGLVSGPFFISRGLNTWLAQASLMITSALVNFACRKFIVFLR